MYKPKPLRLTRFGRDRLRKLSSTQARYLRCYLHDLEAKWVIEEPYYFDRDYLDEFVAFYSTSARGYRNVCRRLLFFGELGTKSVAETRDLLEQALAREGGAAEQMKEAFLGFTILRPIPKTPFGRTVLRWYPEREGALPRVTESKRAYAVHLAGLHLSVRGLAWQQQDSAVGACATVGVWTMLHSSAFKERLSIPTTASITRAAHRTASLGDRVFPSAGLGNHQLLEAIKEHGLAPIIRVGDLHEPKLVGLTEAEAQEGDVGSDAERGGAASPDFADSPSFPVPLFSVGRFSSSCAALLRSGFPVLLSGKRGRDGHVVCVVGFRPAPPVPVATGVVGLDDSTIEHLYVHDDTLGPNVRFRVEAGQFEEATIVPDAPDPKHPPLPVESPTEDVEAFIPTELIVAVHNDVRVSPDHVHGVALRVVQPLADLIKKASLHLQPENREGMGLGLSVRYLPVARYLGGVLQQTLGDGEVLSRTRLSLIEKVVPMSLRVAVVRVGAGGHPLFDILYDTTDSEPNLSAFAHVIFDPLADHLLQAAATSGLGTKISAFRLPPRRRRRRPSGASA